MEDARFFDGLDLLCVSGAMALQSQTDCGRAAAA
jgi:hypothetical protein